MVVALAVVVELEDKLVVVTSPSHAEPEPGEPEPEREPEPDSETEEEDPDEPEEPDEPELAPEPAIGSAPQFLVVVAFGSVVVVYVAVVAVVVVAVERKSAMEILQNDLFLNVQIASFHCTGSQKWPRFASATQFSGFFAVFAASLGSPWANGLEKVAPVIHGIRSKGLLSVQTKLPTSYDQVPPVHESRGFPLLNIC